MNNYKDIDFNKILANLSAKRPIFHSEADFQFEFSWELKETYPEIPIRLERKEIISGYEFYFDIVLFDSVEPFVIELKYKTRKTKISFNNETYNLTDHSANGNGRYDYLKDIFRIETYIKNGLAIFLTNDHLYWDERKYDPPTMDENLRIHNGIELHGTYDWDRSKYNKEEELIKSIGKERLNSIEIKGHYKLYWREYSQIENSKFKYLMVEIR